MDVVYGIEGMTCGGCVSSVSKALERAMPDLQFEVVLAENAVHVRSEHQESAVKEAVEDAGFDFTGER